MFKTSNFCFNPHLSLWEIFTKARHFSQRKIKVLTWGDYREGEKANEVALLDELFQSNRPVLTGVDAHSTYCFLLESVEHRDEDTWGWYLLEASAQGLNPDYTKADAGKGIRAGQKAAWGDKPCHGDVWHIFDHCEALCRNLAKKAQGATTKREELERKMESALPATFREISARQGSGGISDEINTQSQFFSRKP